MKAHALAHPIPDAPTPDQIRQATSTLADLAAYLRSYPPLDEALPLLAPLLDEDDGVPILLGDALRPIARIIGRDAPSPWSEETRSTMEAFRNAAQEVTDWYVLHWTVQRLRTQVGAPGR
ncbi:hypothetical protein AB0H82_32785 [Streptomyces sp. NPDC050732]|uniref:hypothetical protein n=1 Tax=Streptomyces sp. NPDC050732 TaxID=3154632 RepID=UPI003422D918